MIASGSALLETAFDVFNRVYFSDELPRAVITIQSSPRSYGYITTSKVWTDSTDQYYEINIGAEYLSRPIENVMATLMHEMIHLYCLVKEIRDTSNAGRYHNKRFKAEAEKRDLRIEYAKYIGYSVTFPTDGLVETIRANGLYSDIDLCRKTGGLSPTDGGLNGPQVTPGGDNGEQTKRKSSTRKYVCPHCGISVRATKEVFILCGNCMDTMLENCESK